jgi:magnesium transporter
MSRARSGDGMYSERTTRIAASKRDERLQTIAGGEAEKAPLAPDVVETEAAPEVAAGAVGLAAWLFREDAEPREVSFSEVARLAADDEDFVWVDLTGYGPDDLTAIADELELPEAAVGIALAGWERPRVSISGECYLVSVTVPYSDPAERRVVASELDLFVGRNYLVSAHKRPIPFAESLLARGTQNPALLKLDSAFLLSIVIDELLSHFGRLTEEVQDEIEALEERALTDTSEAFLQDLLRLKRYVFAIYRLASQHRPIVAAFIRPDFPFAGGDTIEPYFRDLSERLAQLLDSLEAAKEAVNGAFDLYVSEVSRQANDIMKVLTIVSTILLPSTVILSFWGTNFDFSMITSMVGFVVMMLLIVIVTIGSVLLFHRWGWIGKARK